jgi:hypothetical protein
MILLFNDLKSQHHKDPGSMLDLRHRFLDSKIMKARKPARTVKEVPTTKGTVTAAKYRARANQLSDEERQAHRARAMSVIYGNPNGSAIDARSR